MMSTSRGSIPSKNKSSSSPHSSEVIPWGQASSQRSALLILCESLLQHLRIKPRSLLDEKGHRAALLAVREEIDAALASTAKDFVLPQPSTLVDEASAKSSRCTQKKVAPKLWVTHDEEQRFSSGRRGQPPLAPQLVPPSASTHKRQVEGQREQKVRLMTAVQSYAELSLEESNLTGLEAFFGRQFFEWWWRHKRILNVGPLPTTMFFGTCALLYCHLLLPLEPSGSAMLAALFGFLVIFLAFRQASFWNLELFRRSLKTVDALIFIAEFVMFGVSLSGVFCFSFSGWFLAFSFVVGTAGVFLVYDSYPISLRKGMKVSLVSWSLLFPTYLALIYLRMSPNMCSYKLDFSDGIALYDDKDSNDRRIAEQTLAMGEQSGKSSLPIASEWSLSVVEFCLNRGFSLLMLMFRTTYLAFRHPKDCVILRSRLRIIELSGVPVTSLSGRGSPSATPASPTLYQSPPSREEKDTEVSSGASPSNVGGDGEQESSPKRVNRAGNKEQVPSAWAPAKCWEGTANDGPG